MLLKNMITGLAAVTCVLLGLTISGCICCNFGLPGDVTPTPEPWPTESPTGYPVEPTQEPDTYTPIHGTAVVIPTPAADVTPTPAADVTPTPVSGIMDAEMVGYGTDQDTYNRGDTATCYVEVRNTGEVPIERVDFIVNVYTTRPFIGKIHAIDDQTYTVDQQGIEPGTTKRVEISVVIPESYQGFNTAGDYQFEIVVRIGDKEIGNFSKDIKVV
ncbi:hypothetical protein [Methanocella sp. MCL-LM]|uniref:hypothetical protein n=1 Tax=Methanocella sp. MCL-LM TaxID=3412035 RepID=UPI003C714F36